MFKTTKGETPYFMNDVFNSNVNIGTENASAHTRLQSHFYNPTNPKKVFSGLETLRVLGPKIWNLVPGDIKKSSSVSIFKDKIKTWVPTHCPCRICKIYAANLGFI